MKGLSRQTESAWKRLPASVYHSFIGLPGLPFSHLVKILIICQLHCVAAHSAAVIPLSRPLQCESEGLRPGTNR